MSTQTIGGRVPELTLGWRLKMALGDMRRDDIAESLGVNPATVTRWMGDRGAKPRRAYILQWAMVTGVDPEWLETGKDPHQGGPDEGLSVLRTRRDSNPKPSDPKVRGPVGFVATDAA